MCEQSLKVKTVKERQLPGAELIFHYYAHKCNIQGMTSFLMVIKLL